MQNVVLLHRKVFSLWGQMPQTPDQGLYLLVDNTIHEITGYLVYFYIADGD